MTQMSEVESYFASLQSRLHQAEHMRRRKVGFEGWNLNRPNAMRTLISGSVTIRA